MDKSKRKMTIGNRITTAIAAAVILLSICWSTLLYGQMDFRMYKNEIRVLLEEYNEQLAQGIYHASEYPYMVCGLDGLVFYADESFRVKEGDKCNIQEILQMDEYFGKSNPGMIRMVFALMEENTAKGFIVYLVPEVVLKGTNYNQKVFQCILPAVTGIMISFFLLAGRILFLNKRIFLPMREIVTSANQIIQGNYEYEYKRVFSNKVNADEIGELIYSFELMRDELKEKQIREEELKRAQQELISCISHDLKTPISTIKAYAEGIRDGIARDEATKAGYIRIIIEKTNLLTGMIEDLLKCSNAQLNQLDLCCKEVYFLPFFEKSMKEIAGFVEQQDVRFSFAAELEDRIVTIDEKRILEVLYNLVENSMKYRKADCEIRILASREEENVLIRVIDNGIGINSDDIPYVFDKFYRAEKSRTSSIPGSGLGLSICKYMIEQHGGNIYCKSLKGEGCEIGFTIK